MTTNTYIGDGTYVTVAKPGIISYCDVGITNSDSPYTALGYDRIIRANATSGAITINLPTAVGIAGKEYHIFRTDFIQSTNLVTIDANSTETMDDNLTHILYPGEWIRIESDGANWLNIGRSQSSTQNYYMMKGSDCQTDAILEVRTLQLQPVLFLQHRRQPIPYGPYL